MFNFEPPNRIPENCNILVCPGDYVYQKNNIELNGIKLMDLSTVIRISAEIYKKYKEREEAQQREEDVNRIINEIKQSIDAASDKIIKFLLEMRLQDIVNNHEYAKRKWLGYQGSDEDFDDLQDIIDTTLKVCVDLIPEVERGRNGSDEEKEHALKAFSILSNATAQRGMAILENYYRFNNDKRNEFSFMWKDFTGCFNLIWDNILKVNADKWRSEYCYYRNHPEEDFGGLQSGHFCRQYQSAALLANQHLEMLEVAMEALNKQVK
ncbi:hypothetical protein [Bacillus halotolerans]|uniref:hypothetical protein n=1 Tax=Bacillus halotolerans TaxID=260554 RepID=UPI002E1D8B9F|nr:hypothetical protein [Bacillus subtilis]